jgi:peptidoglycan/LPS O-acetylase OafA/YrhL
VALYDLIRQRVSELDGLRGIAILLVLALHFTPATLPAFLQSLLQLGWTGVDLFFVLSGYLITGILLDSAGRRDWYRNFVVRRSLRIFPAYYVSLAVCCVVTYPPIPHPLAFLRAGGWWYVIWLGNVKVLLDSAWPGLTVLTPLWSLQLEEQFYLSFPWLVRALPRKTLAKALAAAIVAALALRVILTLAIPRNAFAVYTLMPCRMDALAMGGLIAIARRDWPHWLQGRWIGWLTLAAAAVFAGIVPLDSSVSSWPVGMQTFGYTALDLTFAGILTMLVGWRQPWLLKLCRLRLLVWLGTISYGLYLFHIPAQIVGRRLTALAGVPPSGLAESFISLALAIVSAWFSWTFFESRILKLRDRVTPENTGVAPEVHR